MKTVLFFKASEFSSARQKIRGVSEIAHREQWNVQFIEPINSIDEVRKLLAMWKPDGCIVSGGAANNNFSPSELRNIPTVFIDRPLPAALTRRRNAKAADAQSYVYHDSAATAALAAKELLSLNLPYYAYANWPIDLPWNRERRRAFLDILRQHGHKVEEFSANASAYKSHEFSKYCGDWLRHLPKPIGILAAADQLAIRIASACRLVGLSVPDDVAIIGIDNDENLCERSNPSLSSVEPDFAEAGRLAAEQLARLMASSRAKPLRCTYPPLRIVRRASTRRLNETDKTVSDALELIRLKACCGLTAKEVLDTFNCSRRMAEMRFRKFARRSVLDEILMVRLAKAKELLSGPYCKLDAIANFCGYKSAIAFSLFFKRETGYSPSAWKQLKGSATTLPTPNCPCGN